MAQLDDEIERQPLMLVEDGDDLTDEPGQEIDDVWDGEADEEE